jgi:hypothetical protein
MTERPREATRYMGSLEERDYRALSETALADDASLSRAIRQAIGQFVETSSSPGVKPPPASGRKGNGG